MTNLIHYHNDCNNGKWEQSDIFCRLDYPLYEIFENLCDSWVWELGQAVARVAQAFGANVIVAERQGAKTIRPNRMIFEEAIRCADIISIHTPLTEETFNLFDSSVLNLMKPSAVLINTARGGIINEADLCEVLNDICGAALDVLQQEPPDKKCPLQYKGENLLLTPHIAWATKESINRLILGIAENIVAFKQGKIQTVSCR